MAPMTWAIGTHGYMDRVTVTCLGGGRGQILSGATVVMTLLLVLYVAPQSQNEK